MTLSRNEASNGEVRPTSRAPFRVRGRFIPVLDVRSSSPARTARNEARTQGRPLAWLVQRKLAKVFSNASRGMRQSASFIVVSGRSVGTFVAVLKSGSFSAM